MKARPNLLIHRRHASFFAVLLLGLFPDFSSAQLSTVRPVLECVVEIGAGDYVAYFGYLNENSTERQVPIGSTNRFTPSPIDRGQPTDFLPGRQRNVLIVPFDGSNLVWTLEGRTSTASSGSSRCLLPPNVVSVVRSDSDPTNASSVGFTVTFSEDVTGVDAGDFVVSAGGFVSATVSGLSGSGDVYQITLSSVAGDGTLRLDVVDDNTIMNAAMVALGGNGVGDGDYSAGESYTIDQTAPSVSINSIETSPTSASPIPVTITFSEAVVGFDTADVVVANGSALNLQSTDDILYTADITPVGDGTVTVDVPAGSGADAAGNVNPSSPQFSIVSDAFPATVTISTIESTRTSANPIPVTITFSETVIGFEMSDIVVGNGTPSNLFTSDNTVFTAEIVVVADGLVTVNVPAGAAVDNVGNPSDSANQLTLTYDSTPLTVLVIDGFQPAPGDIDGNIGPGTPTGPNLLLDCDTDDDGELDRVYVIRDIVEVKDGGVMSVQAGCRVLADPNQPAAIVVRRGGRFDALGTAPDAVVMTSANNTTYVNVGPSYQSNPGMAATGDWGGLVLVGNGSCNGAGDSTDGSMPDGIPGDCEIDGIDDSLPGLEDVDAIDTAGQGRLTFGGPAGIPGGSIVNDGEDSGSLRYLRIEYAGRDMIDPLDPSVSRYLATLTLAGIGDGTVIENVQIRHGTGAGLSVRGGSVNLMNLVISEVAEEGIRYADGWTGDVQFVVIQRPAAGYSAIRGVNNYEEPGESGRADYSLTPRSRPRIFNITIIGRESGDAITLERGTRGLISNGLAGAWSQGLDINNADTFSNCNGMASGQLFLNAFTFSEGTDVAGLLNLYNIDGDSETTCTGPGVFLGLTGLPLSASDPFSPNFQPLGTIPGVTPPGDGVLDSSGAGFRGAVTSSGTPFYNLGNWVRF